MIKAKATIATAVPGRTLSLPKTRTGITQDIGREGPE